ncbi:serine aminopeptidase domain-containing protein [Actinobacillus equuli]|uniref:serine aminopeptidase domain-containing protein n=1 Tax=Actinobacillus equuli TaxID=718 RepID=UPI0024433BA5|nr:alpha/beta hydrolase [Actinobacillus equuli]WGE46083.1 alpha/beta hydrolase [Actinobacillus equuli subsp. haemolyticus]
MHLKYLSLALLIGTASAQTVNFNLQAEVFDYGQNVTAIELETKHLAIPAKVLKTSDFQVHVKSSLPINAMGNKVAGEFDTARKITEVAVNQQGNIVLSLEHGKDITGSNTLAYIAGDIGRNVQLGLDYQVRQTRDLAQLPKDTAYRQQALIDHEVAKFTAYTSQQGIHYQLFQPQNPHEKRPLIIWLHGNGEGGAGAYQNNISTLLANRGGVAFASDEAQKIFGGAYVVVPQVPDTWYLNYQKDYIHQIKALIDEVNANHQIDRDRIYLFGASAGGYMSLRMLLEYPDFFAATVATAPALDKAPIAGGVPTTEQELQRIQGKPLWLVHAANDPTISYPATSKRVFQTLRDHGAILSVYPEVKIGEATYNGHWSWIYTLRNIPKTPHGESLFEWTAKQKR